MRFLDKWIGSCLCAILSLLQRLKQIFGKETKITPQKILLIKLIEQGATVIAYSAIKTAVSRYGVKNVFFVVFKENRPILDLIGILPPENIISIRNNNLYTLFIDGIKFLKKCRTHKIDTTVDMEFFARASAMLAFLSGAKIRVGLDRFFGDGPYRGHLMTHRVSYNPYMHTGYGYRLLIDAIEDDLSEVPLLKKPWTDIKLELPNFVPNSNEVNHVIAKIKQETSKNINGPILLLNANAGDLLPARKWPTGRFVKLATEILKQYPNATVIFTGSPSEAKVSQQLSQNVNDSRAISLAGKTSLRELLVLYTFANILITNDSGPGHFSTMTDIHSIVLFGPETPDLFGGLSKNTHAISKRLACSPCVNVFNHRKSPCNNNICMQLISVHDVMKSIQSCLNRN